MPGTEDDKRVDDKRLSLYDIERLGFDYDELLNKDFFTGDDIRKMFRLVPPKIFYYENTTDKGKIVVEYPAHLVLTNWRNAWLDYKEGKRPDNPLDNPRVVEHFKDIIEMGRRQVAEKLGPLGPALLHSHGNITFDFDDYHPRFFLKWAGNYKTKPLDYGGNICIIYGTQGSGKTSKALKLFVEGGVSEGIEVMGNIQLQEGEEYEGYTYVTRESDILLRAIQNAMRGVPSLAIKDEQQLGGFDKTHTTTIENQEDDALIRLTRKLKLSEVRIWHEERKFSAGVIGSAKMLIKCYGGTEKGSEHLRKRATFINMRDGVEISRYDITGIPNTSIRYKSDDPAPFIMDISITQVYQYLARVMPETNNDKSHLELLRDEILLHRRFFDETGKRVERKTLKEFEKWREEVVGVRENRNMSEVLDEDGT